MRRLIILCFVLLGVTLGAAQDSAYRLHNPTAEEFLRALPLAAESQDRNAELVLGRELEQYSDLSALPFQALYGAYRVVEPARDFLGWSDTFDQWPEWLVFAWLRDHHVNLETTDQLTFEDFSIQVRPIDFNRDGQDEWLLDIQSDMYRALWVLKHDESQPSGYRKVQTAWPFSYSPYCSIHSGCGGGAQVLGVEDVNADGLPELLISSGSCGYGICGVGLHILAWGDGELVDLALPDGPFQSIPAGAGDPVVVPPDGTWTFQNLDDDPAEELVQSAAIDGSMNCSFRTQQIFDWNEAEDRYVSGDEQIDYADSPGCAMRQAHLALKDSDYETAIVEYERALQTFPADVDPEIEQYARLRLASAYALDQQAARATELIDGLSQEVPASTLMGAMIQAAEDAYLGSRNPVALCAAMYHALGESVYTSIAVYGQIDDYSVTQNYGGGDFSKDNTGCNLTALLDRDAAALTPGSQTPPEQLQQMGWTVTSTFHTDLNGDGLDEWFIWAAEFEDRAIVLTTGDGTYHVARLLFLDQPNSGPIITARESPTGQGKLIVSIEPMNEYNPCPSDASPYRMSLYAVQDTALNSLGLYTLCGDASPNAVFTSARTFRAWETSSNHLCSDKPAQETSYTWDDSEGEFVRDAPIPCAELSLSEGTGWFGCGQYGAEFCGFYFDGDQGLQAIDAVLAQPPDFVDDDFLKGVHYWRGYLLQALGRDDEALAEYVALYEADPESPWGILAGLHLEAVGG